MLEQAGLLAENLADLSHVYAWWCTPRKEMVAIGGRKSLQSPGVTMRKLPVFLVAIAACGGSTKPMPDAAKDTGFNMPTASMRAFDNTGSTPVDKGPADLSCLNTVSVD